jgi:hypothetical protein
MEQSNEGNHMSKSQRTMQDSMQCTQKLTGLAKRAVRQNFKGLSYKYNIALMLDKHNPKENK